MERRNFAQVLKEAKIDIEREYNRLYNIFYIQKFFDGCNNVTLKDCCEYNFLNYPFRGTCLSLEDFEEFYNIHFERVPQTLSLEYLISFCEYTYNLVIYLNTINVMGRQAPHFLYCTQVSKVVEEIGYMFANDNGVTIFVPKSQEAISVSEIIDPKLSYKVIEYNHYSLQGNIEGKKSILLMLADRIERERKKLRNINKTLETNLFMLFNNMNLRHDNCSKDSSKYIEAVACMPKNELENWYDETYQLCLLAFLELDNVDRNIRLDNLKNKIGKGI